MLTAISLSHTSVTSFSLFLSSNLNSLEVNCGIPHTVVAILIQDVKIGKYRFLRIPLFILFIYLYFIFTQYQGVDEQKIRDKIKSLPDDMPTNTLKSFNIDGKEVLIGKVTMSHKTMKNLQLKK